MQVIGVRTENDVRLASQRLFDIFAREGIGQAMFEVDAELGEATLILKHLPSVVPSRGAVERALQQAGGFTLKPPGH